MGPVVGIGLSLILDEIGRVSLLLADPATPEVVNTFLVTSRADDSKSMKIN